ncbi:MAG: transcriptional regulator [Chitinophagaceae bacterium]|nr:MAG: transcriptional regulator [Chitinophagaceae bacterium]
MNEEVLSVAKNTCLSKTRHISDALYVLNGKWKIPLIFTLRHEPARFNQILRSVEGITPKVLAKELRELENNGFIIRKEDPSARGVFIYEATDYADTLESVLAELDEWGRQHLRKIKTEMRGAGDGPATQH